MTFLDTNNTEYIISDKSRLMLSANLGVAPASRYRVHILGWTVAGSSVIVYVTQDTYEKLKRWISPKSKNINE